VSINLDHVTPAGYRMTIEGKAPRPGRRDGGFPGGGAGKFDENMHPRDRLGRFIETGAEVRVWGGQSGRVVRNVGGGRIEIVRSDGTHVIVHRNYLTVTKRPDGSAPTAQQGNVADMPEQAPEKPDAQEIAVPSQPTPGADTVRDQAGELADAIMEQIDDQDLADEVRARANAYHAAVNNDVPGDEADERAALRETLDRVQTSGGGDTDVDALVSDIWKAAATEPTVATPDQPDAPAAPDAPTDTPAAPEGPSIADQLESNRGETVDITLNNGDTVSGRVVSNLNGNVDIVNADGGTDRLRVTDIAKVDRGIPAAPEGWGTVENPDDPMGSPSYDGPLDQAHTRLAPGTYDATDRNGAPVTLTVTDDSSTVSPRSEGAPGETPDAPTPDSPAPDAPAPDVPADTPPAPDAPAADEPVVVRPAGTPDPGFPIPPAPPAPPEETLEERLARRRQEAADREARRQQMERDALDKAGFDDRWTVRGNIFTTSVDKLKAGDVIYTRGDGTEANPVELPSTSGGNVRPNARTPRTVDRVERMGKLRVVHFTDGTSTGREGGSRIEPTISGRVSVAGVPGQQPKAGERPVAPAGPPETMDDLGDLPAKAYPTQQAAEQAGFVFGGDTSDLTIGEEVVGFSRDRFRTARVAKIGRVNATVEYTTPTAINDSLKRALWARTADPESWRKSRHAQELKNWDFYQRLATQDRWGDNDRWEVRPDQKADAQAFLAKNPDREAYAAASAQKEYDRIATARANALAMTPQDIIDNAHMTTKVVKLSEIGRHPDNVRKAEPPAPPETPGVPGELPDPTTSIENLRAYYRSGQVGANDANREFLVKLADEPSLMLSSSGDLMAYKRDNTTWVISDTRSGLSLGHSTLGSQWGGKKQASVLMEKYVDGLPGFDWSDAKQSMTDWRSPDDLNMVSSLMKIKGKHDVDAGKDTLAAQEYRRLYGVTIEPDDPIVPPTPPQPDEPVTPPTPPAPPEAPEFEVNTADVRQLDDGALGTESLELSNQLGILMNEQGRTDSDPTVAAIVARQREITNERHRRIAEARRVLIPEGEDVSYHELKPGDTVVVPFVTERGPEIAMIASVDGNQIRLRFDDGTEQSIYAVGQIENARWRRGAVVSTETVPSGDLQPGDRILLEDGTSAKVEAITRDGDRVTMAVTDENGVSRLVYDDRFGSHLRVSSDSSPEAIRPSVTDMSDDELTIEAGSNLAAGSDGSPEHPLFKRQQAVYAEQRHRRDQELAAVPVDVVGTDEATARPRLYTYQRKNLVALNLDTPGAGASEEVQQAAARVRARLPLTTAQSEALRDYLDGLADDPSLRVVKQRSMRRLAQSFDASATVSAGRRATASQPGNDRVQRVRITGLTAGDTAVIRNSGGALVTVRVTDVQPMMRGTVARVTYTEPDGFEVTRIIDRDADVFLMPDLPDDKPSPVEPRAELELAIGSDLRVGDTITYMRGGEYLTGQISEISEIDDGRWVTLGDAEHSMEIERGGIYHRTERGGESSDQPYLYTVTESAPEATRGPDVQVGDRIVVDLFDPPARGTVYMIEDVPAEGGGRGHRINFFDDSGNSMSITLFDDMTVQRTAKAADNATLAIKQTLEESRQRERRHAVRLALDEIQNGYVDRVASSLRFNSYDGREAVLRALEAGRTNSLRTIEGSRELRGLMARLDTSDIAAAGQIKTQLVDDVYSRMRVSIEQAELLPGETETEMIQRVLQQHRDYPPTRRTDTIAAALLSNIGELGKTRQAETGDVELPKITGEDLTSRMEQYREAIGTRFGHRSMRVASYGKLDLNALERGEAPKIEYAETFMRDTAADDGPGETTMKQLAIVKAAGRDLDANLQDDIDKRVRQKVADIPTGVTVGAYMQQLQEMHDRLAKERGALLNRMFDRNLTQEERDAARAEHQLSRDASDADRLRLNEVKKAFKDAQRWAAKDLISKVRQVGGVRLKYQKPDTTSGRNAYIRGSGKPMTDRDKNVKAMRTAEDVLPTDWLAAIDSELATGGRYNRGGFLGLGESTRGYADYQGNIRLSEYGGPQFEGDPGRGRVAVHELGHFAQRAVPGLLAAERAYIWSRTSSGEVGNRTREQLVNMDGIGGDSSQYGYKDDFKTAYAGVDYAKSKGRQGTEAWEIITIGLESLFAGSEYLDDDYRQWLLGTLALV
jgi:preprotein translocase subunit YajC